MKSVLVAFSVGFFAFSFFVFAPTYQAVAGSCDHSYDTARDGSSCGGRAADQRRGGK